MRAAAVGLAAALAGSACGYYNGMWSADHLAGQARKQEQEGRREEARASWAQAAVKAESVVTRHPHGRWADAALVLQGEGLAKSADCDRAAAPLARALGSVKDTALLERAALAAAECDLAGRDLAAAERLLGPVTRSADGRRAAHAWYLSGRLAELRGDRDAAAERYGRSAERAAHPARAQVLLAAGHTEAGVALLDTVAHGDFKEEEWAGLLADVSRAASAEIARRTLDRLLARRHVPAGSRARLLLADADRLFAVGALAAAAARYGQAAAAAPDSTDGQRGRVGELRVLAAQAESLAQLRAVGERLGALQTAMGGAAAADSRDFERRVRQVLDADNTADAALFHRAELVRDSLAAPRLAASLFLAFARQRTASLFAPKALVAAAQLAPERAESVSAVLQSAYPASPYTLALRGDVSPGYAAAEDSLARALGVAAELPAVLLGPQVAPPVPGQRGPPLEPPAAAGPAPARPGQPRGPGRTPGRRAEPVRQ